jgi:hypothetical protein
LDIHALRYSMVYVIIRKTHCEVKYGLRKTD